MSQSRPASDESAARDLPSLDDFLIECQKSLARVSSSSSEASKADSEFARGERPNYAVDGITFKLHAGIHLGSSQQWPDSKRIQLDFHADPEARSELVFRVEARPVEVISGAKLEIANLDPVGDDLPTARLRVWLVNDQGQPVEKYPVQVHFSPAGRKDSVVIPMTTDVTGRRDFFYEAKKPKSNLKIVGIRARKTVYLRGGGRGRGDDEFYVWATCRRKKEWKTIVDPATGTVVELKEPAPKRLDEMRSERIRIRLPGKRQS